MKKISVLMAGAGIVLGGCGSETMDQGPPAPKGSIQVRTMTNLTGATSENGAPYYMGIKDFIRETNAAGGIKGYLIEEKTVDHAYMKDRWTAAYDDWKMNDPAFDKVVQFFSWGTPDTQQFSKEAEMRAVPWISGSYATTLATPLPQSRMITMPDGAQREFTATGAPFNFFAGTDYSTQIRIAMEFVKKRGGKKVGFAYCTNSGFCLEPIPPGKVYAKQIGLALVGEGKQADDVNLGLGDNYDQVDEKVKAYAASNPDVDWFWVGNSIFSSTHFAKAVKKYFPNAKLIMNLYGMDERTWELCGADCVGNAFSVQPFAAYGDTRHTGMEQMLKVYKKWRAADGEPEEKWANMRYTQGYVSFYLFVKGIEKLIDGGKEITGRNLKEAYETFRGLPTGDLTPPVTFTASDHRPSNLTRIYSMNMYGKLRFEDEMSVQQQTEWLGW